MSYKIIQPNDVRFTLVHNNEPHVIDLSPDKWSEHEFSNKRDLSFWGVMRNYATDIEFVGVAAEIIRSVFFTEGVDALITLKIELLNRSTWEYKIIYSGDLDLSTFEDFNNRVVCNLIESGVNGKIQARKTVKYEFSFKPTDPTINIPASDILEWMNINAAAYTESRGPSGANMAYYFPSTQAINYSIILGGIVLSDQILLDGALAYNYINGDNCIFKSESFNGTINLKGYFTLNVRQQNNNGWVISIVDSSAESGGNKKQLISTLASTGGQFTRIRFDFDTSLNVVEGRKYFLIVESYDVQNFAVNYADIVASELKFEYNDLSDEILIKAKHPKDFITEIASEINEDDVEVISDLLDENYNLLITSGDAIRGYPNPLIKSSFDDFYKSIDSLFCTGLGMNEGKITIEKREHFFNNSEDITHFGDVTEVKINPFTDVMYASITAGYGKFDYEIEQGKNEFNQGQEYTTDQLRVKSKYECKSIYRADQYGIDSIRISEINKDSNEKESDNKNDNDVFFILCKKDTIAGNYEPIDQNGYLIKLNGSTGVDRSVFYNFLISPKHNLLNHVRFLKSTLFGNNEGVLTFTASDRNSDLEVQKIPNGVNVIENAPIQLGLGVDRLFYPILVEFETNIKPNLQSIIDLQSNGVCSFNFRGYIFKGFIMSIDLNANRGSTSLVRLILSPDTDLNLLI